jgi:hypothetical protein
MNHCPVQNFHRADHHATAVFSALVGYRKECAGHGLRSSRLRKLMELLNLLANLSSVK